MITIIKQKKKRIPVKHFYKHKTKRKVLIKFILVLSIFLAYLFFVIYKYGIEQGLLVSFLSWSFFVLCTPIADAGFLLDFPFRLITNLKMLYSELTVWFIAISLNIWVYLFHPQIYQKTSLLKIFHQILTQPIPFWIIIFISAIGTFASVVFGDELLDKIAHKDRQIYNKHKNKYFLVITFFLFFFALFLYKRLLASLGIEI